MGKKRCKISKKKYEKKDTTDMKYCCGKCKRKSDKKKNLCHSEKATCK